MEQKGRRFLSFTVMGADARAAWEEILRNERFPLDTLDLSERACSLLEATDSAVWSSPPWALARLAEDLRAPAKTRGDRRKLARWITDHWHRADVRTAASRHLKVWVIPALSAQRVDPDKIREIRQRRVPWTQVLWSAFNSPDPDALAIAREAWGPDEWDQNMAAFLEEVRPALWVLLVRPEIERIAERHEGRQRIRELAGQVQVLSWEADRAKDRHRRATDRLREMGEEIERLRKELAERDRRIRDMEEAMAEERRLWAEMLDRAKAARMPQKDGAQTLPLAGKRVAVVGGDPIAAGAAALVESLGGEPVICPGFDQVARVPDAVRAADVVVAVTACMSHKHAETLKAALRDGQRLVWVNSTGLTTLRRALTGGLERAG